MSSPRSCILVRLYFPFYRSPHIVRLSELRLYPDECCSFQRRQVPPDRHPLLLPPSPLPWLASEVSQRIENTPPPFSRPNLLRSSGLTRRPSWPSQMLHPKHRHSRTSLWPPSIRNRRSSWKFRYCSVYPVRPFSLLFFPAPAVRDLRLVFELNQVSSAIWVVSCKKQVDNAWLKTRVMVSEVPLCQEPTCKGVPGAWVKPDIVFFGEVNSSLLFVSSFFLRSLPLLRFSPNSAKTLSNESLISLRSSIDIRRAFPQTSSPPSPPSPPQPTFSSSSVPASKSNLSPPSSTASPPTFPGSSSTTSSSARRPTRRLASGSTLGSL
jgi:hypothetical protein